jgi:hypothetical protein
MTEWILALAKSVGLIVAAWLAYRSLYANAVRRGKLTVQGKRFRAYIWIAAAVGIIVSVLEYRKSEIENQDNVARVQRLQTELERIRRPITHFRLTFSIELNPDHPTIQDYINRISNEVEENLPKLRSMTLSKDAPVGMRSISVDRNGDPSTIVIERASPLWPKLQEPDLFFVVNLPMLQISFRKTPIVPENTYPIHGEADFSGSTFGTTSATLHWVRSQRRLFLNGRTEAPKELWHVSGAITSLPDLLGAQVLVVPPQDSRIRLPDSFTKNIGPIKRNELLDHLQLHFLIVSLADGDAIWLRRSQFKRGMYRSGGMVLHAVFPNNEKAFRQFVRPSDDD